MKTKTYITLYKDNKPIIVDEKLFQENRIYIIDSINAYLKHIYNKAKEQFAESNTNTLECGKIDVTTNLKGGISFTNDGEVTFVDPDFKEGIQQLINDISALMLTYNRPEEFLTVMQTDEFWSLLIFVAADQASADLLTDALIAFFNATWGNTKNDNWGNTLDKNQKEYLMRKSFLDMMITLRSGYDFDLANLKVYNSDWKEVKFKGVVKSCNNL